MDLCEWLEVCLQGAGILQVSFKAVKAMNLNFFNQVIRNIQLSYHLLDANFPDVYCPDTGQILSIDDGFRGRVRELEIVFQVPDQDVRV